MLSLKSTYKGSSTHITSVLSYKIAQYTKIGVINFSNTNGLYLDDAWHSRYKKPTIEEVSNNSSVRIVWKYRVKDLGTGFLIRSQQLLYCYIIYTYNYIIKVNMFDTSLAVLINYAFYK